MPSRPKPFQQIAGANPPRSIFNLSYSKKFTCDMGQIVPILCEEAVPGDIFKIGNNILIRFQPLLAPVLHEVKVKVDYFFVPYRLLWNKWEAFYTRGQDGKLEVPLPKWKPLATANQRGSLWDFLGFPLSVDPDGSYPVTFPRDAYYYVWNEYFRDENLQSRFYTDTPSHANLDDQSVPQHTNPTDTNYPLLNTAWQKDYFTSALPWEQRGDQVAIPLQGYGSVAFNKGTLPGFGVATVSSPTLNTQTVQFVQSSTSYTNFATLTNSAGTALDNVTKALTGSSTIQLKDIATFTVNELRFAFQLQKYFERSARGGYRYIETLKAMFGVHPRDSRLQRPEYIGGTRSHVFFSEVLQTSETGSASPQANMSGHGITAPAGFAGRYRVEEFGVILGVMRVMPTPSYQQGINRQWDKDVVEDYYNPLFSTLGEQAIKVSEIYATNSKTTNEDIFGFQGRWDELRYKPDIVCSEMRDLFEYWHLSRKFSSRPYLNSDFITLKADDNYLKRIFAVQRTPAPENKPVPGLIVNFGNAITAARPLPVISEPSLIDHH